MYSLFLQMFCDFGVKSLTIHMYYFKLHHHFASVRDSVGVSAVPESAGVGVGSAAPDHQAPASQDGRH